MYKERRGLLINLIRSIIVVTLISIIIIFLGSVDIIGLLNLWQYIVISFLFLLLTYLVKGFRFYLICRKYMLGIGLWKALLIRVSSELFSLIGVSYVGDEAFRIYILNREYDVEWGRATSIGYMEVLAEIVVTLMIVFLGVFYMYFSLNIRTMLLDIVILVSFIIAGFHSLLLFKTSLLGKYFSKLIVFLKPIIGGSRVDNIISYIDGFTVSFGSSMQEMVGDKKFTSFIVLLTIISSILGGLSLWILAIPLGVNFTIIISIIILHMSLVLSSLPITISGSGLFELVILVAGESLSIGVPWALPVSFRISTYYLPIIFTLILLLYYVNHTILYRDR